MARTSALIFAVFALLSVTRADPKDKPPEIDTGHKAASWLRARWSVVDNAKQNEFAKDAANKRFAEELASLSGKKVHWLLPCKSAEKAAGGKARITSHGYMTTDGHMFVTTAKMPLKELRKSGGKLEVPASAAVSDVGSKPVFLDATIKEVIHENAAGHPFFVIVVTEAQLVSK